MKSKCSGKNENRILKSNETSKFKILEDNDASSARKNDSKKDKIALRFRIKLLVKSKRVKNNNDQKMNRIHIHLLE